MTMSSASGAPREVLRAVHHKFGIEGLRKIKSGAWQVESLFARGVVRSCYCATFGTLVVADSDSVNEFCSCVCDTGRVRS